MPGKKRSPNPSAEENRALRRNILLVASWVRENIRHFIKPFGLTPKQLEILQILRRNDPEDKGLSILHIREAMHDLRPDTSRLVGRLHDKKLVDRRNGQQDKRFTRVHITPAGENLLARIDAEYEHLNFLTENLSEDELIQLNTLLKKLQGQPDAEETG